MGRQFNVQIGFGFNRVWCIVIRQHRVVITVLGNKHAKRSFAGQVGRFKASIGISSDGDKQFAAICAANNNRGAFNSSTIETIHHRAAHCARNRLFNPLQHFNRAHQFRAVAGTVAYSVKQFVSACGGVIHSTCNRNYCAQVAFADVRGNCARLCEQCAIFQRHRVVAQQFKHRRFRIDHSHNALGSIAPIAGTVNSIVIDDINASQVWIDLIATDFDGIGQVTFTGIQRRSAQFLVGAFTVNNRLRFAQHGDYRSGIIHYRNRTHQFNGWVQGRIHNVIGYSVRTGYCCVHGALNINFSG